MIGHQTRTRVTLLFIRKTFLPCSQSAPLSWLRLGPSGTIHSCLFLTMTKERDGTGLESLLLRLTHNSNSNLKIRQGLQPRAFQLPRVIIYRVNMMSSVLISRGGGAAVNDSRELEFLPAAKGSQPKQGFSHAQQGWGPLLSVGEPSPAGAGADLYKGSVFLNQNHHIYYRIADPCWDWENPLQLPTFYQ